LFQWLPLIENECCRGSCSSTRAEISLLDLKSIMRNLYVRSSERTFRKSRWLSKDASFCELHSASINPGGLRHIAKESFNAVLSTAQKKNAASYFPKNSPVWPCPIAEFDFGDGEEEFDEMIESSPVVPAVAERDVEEFVYDALRGWVPVPVASGDPPSASSSNAAALSSSPKPIEVDIVDAELIRNVLDYVSNVFNL